MSELLQLTTGDRAFMRVFDGVGIRVHPPEGTSILIEGAAGLGKTTLALQLATNAVSKSQASCLYYSFEQTPVEIQSMITSFRWNIPSDVLPWAHPKPWTPGKPFNIVDAQDIIEARFNAILVEIEAHVNSLKQTYAQCTPIVVLDMVGGIENLAPLPRESIGQLVKTMRRLNAILMLVRETPGPDRSVPAEYLTNVVIDLQIQHAMGAPTATGTTLWGPAISRTVMEIKKTRNQVSHRGPHEFTILKPSPPHEPGGFVAYPSLQSIAHECAPTPPGENPLPSETSTSAERARFGIPRLDNKLSADPTAQESDWGMPFGQSLLVKGNPGSLKTELALTFLLQATEEKVLFVSCRIDESVLSSLSMLDDNAKGWLRKHLEFVDARDPYRTPEQVMADIVHKVEPDGGQKIRRAVIFGIGMLDTLPAFQRNALPFLQVLIAYFRKHGVSGIFIDWPQGEVKAETPLLRPTQLAGDFVAFAIDIDTTKDRLVTLKRKYHRFVNDPIGLLGLTDDGHGLIIKEE